MDTRDSAGTIAAHARLAVRERKIKKPKSLTLLALEKIREGITRGEYALGAPLYEKVLAEDFGISKTPVREALVQLQHEGLVVVQPHSGTFVFELANGEVSQLCELRLILETNAVQLAMRRQAGRLTAELDTVVQAMHEALAKKQILEYRELDAQFHRAFFRHCGNTYLAGSYALIEAKLQTLRVNLMKPLPKLGKTSMDEHVQICGALKEQRPDRAIEILGIHIRRSRELMRDLQEVAPVTVEKMA
jgi:DNA-binding GntR family transcriptional regulator